MTRGPAGSDHVAGADPRRKKAKKQKTPERLFPATSGRSKPESGLGSRPVRGGYVGYDTQLPSCLNPM